MNDIEMLRFSHEDAEALWRSWAPDPEDLLAHAAFERMLSSTLDLNEGLFFRPGGWFVNLPAALVRAACAAALLAAGFEIAGIGDANREVIIAAVGYLAALNIQPARLNGDETELARRIRDDGLADTLLSTKEARKVLPRKQRATVSKSDVRKALDRLVAAGVADRLAEDQYVVRAEGKEAWFRLTLSEP